MTGKLSVFAAMSLIGATLALPLPAQEWRMPPAAPGGKTGSAAPLEQGIEGIMNQMFQQMMPHFDAIGDELQATVNELAPALRELSSLVDDFANYQAPERLPNGDIILRRRADAPPAPPTDELRNLLIPPPGGMPSPDTVPGQPEPMPETGPGLMGDPGTRPATEL
ncbi:MAG: hypothetical protein ACK5LJ_15675 [Paracoccus sp. (in: a-proteobacteria)]